MDYRSCLLLCSCRYVWFLLFSHTPKFILHLFLPVAEAFGKTNTSRIIDLFPNNGSVYTPAYAIYEGDNLARVALFNYITDPSGANDYTATISVQGGTVPAQIKVKYVSTDVSLQGTFFLIF